jgi:hypothetical protein
MSKYNDLKQEYLTQHDLKELPSVLPKEEKHAVYSPSAAKRWINCPGSINLCKGLPRQKPNFYSAEGTVAHYIAARKLAVGSMTIPDIWEIEQDIWEMEQDGFRVKVSKEMLEAVNVYVDLVLKQEAKYDEEPEIERKVKITDDCFGTADSIIYSPYRILIVNDYKHGAGIQIDAEMNEQMMIYALGRLLELPKDERLELPIIQMNIIQPRGAGEAIKTFELTPEDLISSSGCWRFYDTIQGVIRIAKQPDAPLNPGDWCKYCPAALTCPALKKENLAVATLAFKSELVVDGNNEAKKWIEVITPKQIAELLDKESMVMAFYKRLNEHAAELASKNTKIPGYSYEKKWGNRKWKDGAQDHFGDYAWAYERKLLSPAQMEKAIKNQGVKIDIKELTEKPFTGYALKKANGKEITVKEVFSEIE